MSLHLFFVNKNSIRNVLLSLAIVFVHSVQATELLDQREVPGGQVITGSTAVISLDPVIPKRGEPFTINISGQWETHCVPDQEGVVIEYREQSILITLNFVVGTQQEECGDVFEPTPYSLSVTIPDVAWEHIDENLPLEIVLRDAQEFLAFSWWRRSFDLIWGLHEIPPRLGSGFWISEETPFQGLLVQQQESTVVLYELKYDRQNGEPNWHMADARFHGNAANGVAYLVSWLQPEDKLLQWTPEFPYRRLPQPETEDMHFEANSAGIVVEGVNRIKVFVGKSETYFPISHYYKRWVFALGSQQLPPVVPDMSGRWKLYGFDGQQLKQSFEFEFKTGTRLENGLYQYSSIDDGWNLDCTVNLDGEGGCSLVSAEQGLKMNYDLLEFNGNLAKGLLNSIESQYPGQTGILLRSVFQLPVLEFQD